MTATVGTETAVYQGTYVRQDPAPSIPKATTASGLARFTFPYIKGHLRAIPEASFGKCTDASCSSANSSRTTISSLQNTIFDAADHIRIGIHTPWGELRRYVVSATAPGPVTAFRVPTSTTNCRARVTAVYSRLRWSIM